MRCLFCKCSSDASFGIEHILPESLGNKSHTLSRGIVCDGCNNYFARKLERPVLTSGHFQILRSHQIIPNKKGRVPVQNAILRSNVPVDMVRTKDGRTIVRVPTKYWDRVAAMKNSEIILAGDGALPDSKLMSRLLAKIALEAMA